VFFPSTPDSQNTTDYVSNFGDAPIKIKNKGRKDPCSAFLYLWPKGRVQMQIVYYAYVLQKQKRPVQEEVVSL
jgi:hypothetical protein